MRILITGIAGFLGSHLAERLQKDGHTISGVDNFIGGEVDNIPFGTDFFFGDTSDTKRMNEILKSVRPDIIYHCACVACEGLSVFSPAFITQNTFSNTIGILSAAINNDVKRFILCSSMARYGKQGVPYTEDMLPMPNDPYACAKVASETTLKMLSETHGIEYAIAIPHNIIGIRQKYDDPFRNVVSIFINRILKGEKPIIYGDGQQTRSFSFVDDCIYSLVRMIDCKNGEIYNIGPDEKDGEIITIKELGEMICKIMGVPFEPLYIEDRPREIKHAYCSSDKIRKEFAYKTTVKLEEGLLSMIEDIKKRGTKEFKYHIPVEIINEKTPKTWTKQIKM
jgi:UDP-glucose 4-epimerase